MMDGIREDRVYYIADGILITATIVFTVLLHRYNQKLYVIQRTADTGEHTVSGYCHNARATLF
jgi:hypothetical protein